MLTENDLLKAPVAKERSCPRCQAAIPTYEDYVSWCECGWGLTPQAPEETPSRFEKLYLDVGKRLGQSLFDELKQSRSFNPRWSRSKLMAVCLAACVHLLTLTFLCLSIILWVRGWPNLFAIGGGIICGVVALFLFPRFGKVPAVAPREKYPALYQLADQIADALHAPKVYGISLGWYYNAGFGQAGWRRRRILYLGLPLFTILDNPEKVHVIAHELAHGVNGDPNRGFFIGAAINSLVRWYYILHPGEIWDPTIVGIPLKLAMLGLSQLAGWGADLLAHLIWQDSQRAEYLADYLAAGVSGSRAALSALEKLHLDGIFWNTAQRLYLNRLTHLELFDTFKRRVDLVPERELERVRRAARLEDSHLNATHPPTGWRMAMLERHPFSSAKVSLSANDSERINKEVLPLQKQANAAQVYLHQTKPIEY